MLLIIKQLFQGLIGELNINISYFTSNSMFFSLYSYAFLDVCVQVFVYIHFFHMYVWRYVRMYLYMCLYIHDIVRACVKSAMNT